MELHDRIMENVIKEELDFIAYVDVETKSLHTVVTNRNTDIIPPIDGDYQIENDNYIRRFVDPEDQEFVTAELELDNIRKKLEEKDRLTISFRLLCKDVYRRKTLNIYYEDSDKNSIVLTRRDVNDAYEEEQKMRKKLYRAVQEAAQTNQEKGEFLERMSHEIRTPMNSIIGLTYLSKENIDNPKQVLENIEKIEMSARFLRSFIDDILNMSLLASGRVARNEHDTKLQPFIEGLAQRIGAKAREKQIVFVTELRGNFKEKYHFDSEKLREALQNVLQNAVKYTQSGGKIDFIVELLQETDENATFRFEVRDTGIGIEQSFIPHVFDTFAQEENRKTTLYGGMGLGLTIAKNIIDFMDGKIDVYSEKGVGSTFVITVELSKDRHNKKSDSKQENAESREFDFTGKRVLLVEDNEINVEIVTNILHHKKFEVDVALDGEKGVKAYSEHEAGYYDVILMDIRMPVMDGLEATKKIRQLEQQGRRTPIVAMTANVFEEDVKKSFEAGMDAHLSKPVDITQMYALLDGIIFG